MISAVEKFIVPRKKYTRKQLKMKKSAQEMYSGEERQAFSGILSSFLKLKKKNKMRDILSETICTKFNYK